MLARKLPRDRYHLGLESRFFQRNLSKAFDRSKIRRHASGTDRAQLQGSPARLRLAENCVLLYASHPVLPLLLDETYSRGVRLFRDVSGHFPAEHFSVLSFT
jgi:hypothetical protein